MHLLVGLGNPGKDYEKTRHNIGFMVIDEIISSYGLSSPKTKFHGIISDGLIDGKKVLAAKPNTFMNKSGLCVGEIVKFYKIPLENIIVFHDEIDLVACKVKVKTGGGHGGHNGLRDIDAKIGKEYKRVRIGVGHPGDKDKVSGYVLKNFSKEETPSIEKLIDDISSNISLLLKNDDSLFMTRISEAG
jgi:PTH1 family peptidyl-tRNA hydrolase